MRMLVASLCINVQRNKRWMKVLMLAVISLYHQILRDQFTKSQMISQFKGHIQALQIGRRSYRDILRNSRQLLMINQLIQMMMAWLKTFSICQTEIGLKIKSRCTWKTKMSCKTLSTASLNKRKLYSWESISHGLFGQWLNITLEPLLGRHLNSRKIINKTLSVNSNLEWQFPNKISQSAKMKKLLTIRIHH